MKSQTHFTTKNKYYPCSTQEWGNSVYTFNKNTHKLLPIANTHVFNLLKSYFNLFSKVLEKNIGLLRIRKWKRRLIGRKIWISKPELKYSNKKILINIYIYNRQLTFFYKKIQKIKTNWIRILNIRLSGIDKKKNILFKTRNINLSSKNLFYKLFIKIFKKLNEKKIKENIYINAIKFVKILRVSLLINEKKNKESKLSNYVNLINKELIKSKNGYVNSVKEFEDILDLGNFLEKNSNEPKFKETLKFITYDHYINLIQEILIHQMSFQKLRQMLLLNELKFRDGFLMPIKWLIQKILKKKIQFNLVSLKKYNHDGNILTQIVTSKIRNRRNKPLKVVNSSLRKTKVYQFNKGLVKQDNIKRSNYSYFFSNIFTNLLPNKILQKIALNSIKHKVIAGLKVQASGRITRRIIAQRAACKIRYKGTLKNIDSSFIGVSSVILKGYEKSGLQYEYSGSYRRIGAFGVKVWMNAY